MIKDNNKSSGKPRPQHRKKPRSDRQFRREVQLCRRLYVAATIFTRRLQYEQRLILQDVEPRFLVSWEKLKRVALNPLGVGFGKLMHKLHRFARCNTAEAARAYHPVSMQLKQPQSQLPSPDEPPAEGGE